MAVGREVRESIACSVRLLMSPGILIPMPNVLTPSRAIQVLAMLLICSEQRASYESGVGNSISLSHESRRRGWLRPWCRGKSRAQPR